MARRQSPDRDDAYDCHIAFVNTGITFADNIQQISLEPHRSDLRNYVSQHGSRLGQSPETLSTLYAMQDGVSSLPGGRGGLGMMEMVEMANKLGTTDDPERQPAVTVISGRSCIRFSGKFQSYLKRKGGRVQLFNDDNRIDLPPDKHYVFDMPHNFPGTIVAMRFSLDCQAQMQRTGFND